MSHVTLRSGITGEGQLSLGILDHLSLRNVDFSGEDMNSLESSDSPRLVKISRADLKSAEQNEKNV